MNNPSYQNRVNIYKQSSPFPVKSNKFDLSYTHKTNVQIGKLIPIGWTTVIPGDKVKLSIQYRAVLETLAKNGFYNLDICFRSYFVSNRIMWKKWDSFYTGGQDGKYSVTPPSWLLTVGTNDGSSKGNQIGGLSDYLGLPLLELNTGTRDSSTITSFQINPFPVVAYDLIYYNYFINPHIEKNLPYYIKSDSVSAGIAGLCSDDFYSPHNSYYFRMFDSVKDLEAYLNSTHGTNFHTTSASATWDAVDYVYNVNWESDYFTDAHLTQSLGSLPVIQPDVNVTFNGENVNIGVKSSYLQSASLVKPGPAPEPLYTYSFDVGADGNISLRTNELPDSSFSTDVFRLSGSLPNSAIGSFSTDDLVSFLNQNTVSGVGFNAFDLRTIFQTTVVQEGSLLGGWEPWDYLFYFFGTRPSDYAMQRPVYIGGFNGKFYTDEVYSTSETADMPLGSYAGKGDSGDNGYIGDYDVKEFGVIMTMCYIRPTGFAYGSQGLRKELFARDRWSWVNPAFVNLQEQPIENKEIFFQGNDEDSKTFGFQSIYDEYRMNKDIVTCDMRKSLSFWHTNRLFNELPVLNPEFLKMKSEDMDRIFMFQDDEIKKRNQIFLNVNNGILIDRNLPLISVPGKLDHRF